MVEQANISPTEPMAALKTAMISSKINETLRLLVFSHGQRE